MFLKVNCTTGGFPCIYAFQLLVVHKNCIMSAFVSIEHVIAVNLDNHRIDRNVYMTLFVVFCLLILSEPFFMQPRWLICLIIVDLLSYV